MKDWRGTDITVGSRVIYVSRQRSYMWVTEGEVVDITGKKVAVRRLCSSGDSLHKSATQNERIVFPSVERITVMGEYAS